MSMRTSARPRQAGARARAMTEPLPAVAAHRGSSSPDSGTEADIHAGRPAKQKPTASPRKASGRARSQSLSAARQESEYTSFSLPGTAGCGRVCSACARATRAALEPLAPATPKTP